MNAVELLRAGTRLLVAWVFLDAGVDVLRKPEPRAETAGHLFDALQGTVPGMPEDRLLLVRANAGVQVVAGALLALGVNPRITAATLALSLIPTTIGGHAFWREDDAARKRQSRVHFNKNLAILGGLLLIVVAPRRRRIG
ncbi:MAG: DoxX family protein [Chloroflexi bacterium]|nr:DoxX family protein [Chloroflexota bacterium]